LSISSTPSITPTKTPSLSISKTPTPTPSVQFPSSGLISYWNFEEASGVVVDCVSHYSGVTTSVTYSAAGIVNHCLSYNGTTSKVTVGSGGTGFPKPTTAFSLSFWIKTTDATSNKKIVFANSFNYGFILYYAGAGTGLVSLLIGDGTNTIEAICTTRVDTGNWTHVVFTFNGTDFLGFVNNSQCATETWAYDVAWTDVDDWTFMANNYGSGFVVGSLDEFGVWNRALTTTEISIIYKGGSGFGYDCGVSPTPSPTPTRTPSLSISATPSMTPTRTPSLSISATSSLPAGSALPTPSITPTTTPSLSISPTRTPSLSISKTPSITPTRTPSLSLPFGGNIYYVATDGLNTNPGTFAEPWATWEYGFNQISAGDLLYIRGGTYTPTSYVTVSSRNCAVAVSGKDGSSGSKYQVFAYPDETPILDCRNVTGSNERIGILIVDCSYWYLKGLEITRVDQPVAGGVGGQGIFIWGINAAEHNTIENCKAYVNGGPGMGTRDWVNETLFLNCDCYDNWDAYSDTPGGNSDGFDVGYSNDIIRFTGCRVWHNGDDGFDMYCPSGWDSTVYLTNCWAWHQGYAPDESGGGDGGGFKLGTGTGLQSDGIIRRYLYNCIAYDNLANGFDQNSGNMKTVIYNSIAYANGTRGYDFHWENQYDVFINNTSYDNGSADAFLSNTTQTTNSWQNGITVTDADFVSVVSQLSSTRESDGSLPLMTFLHLVSGSDLKYAGTVVAGLVYDGDGALYNDPPSIGPFEYGVNITPSMTPTRTPSLSIPVTPSLTPTRTPSLSIPVTPSITPTRTPSLSITSSITPTVTPSLSTSKTPTVTPSLSISATPSLSISKTPTRTPSLSISKTPSITPSTAGDPFSGALEACWNFEEASGTIYDSTTNNHDLTTASYVSYHQAGKVGSYCVGFSNSAGYLQGDTGLDLTTITLSFWIKFIGTGNVACTIYNKTDPANSKGGVRMDAGASGVVSFTTITTGGDNNTISSDSALNDENWHHIVASYNDATQEANLYVDNVGVNANPQIFTNRPDYGVGGVNIQIGGDPSVPDAIPGYIDAFGIWSAALNATDVATLWNGGSGLVCSVPDVTPSPTRTPSLSITKTPSLSISKTPSLSPPAPTPSLSISATPSLSISKTPSSSPPAPTPSLSISATPSLSISKTPSSSPPAPTPSLSISKTPSITPSRTPSITSTQPSSEYSFYLTSYASAALACGDAPSPNGTKWLPVGHPVPVIGDTFYNDAACTTPFAGDNGYYYVRTPASGEYAIKVAVNGVAADVSDCTYPTPTPTRTQTPSRTPTPSLSISRTPSLSPPAATPSLSISITPSLSISRTPSLSPPAATPSLSISRTPSLSISRTPSKTPSMTPSRTPSLSISVTPSISLIVSPSRTPTPTRTPTPSTAYMTWFVSVNTLATILLACGDARDGTKYSAVGRTPANLTTLYNDTGLTSVYIAGGTHPGYISFTLSSGGDFYYGNQNSSGTISGNGLC
jgi:hypothetical protein